MLLKLKQKYKLSQTALNAVTDEFTDLLQSKISQIKDEVHHILTSLPVLKEQLKNLTSVFQQPDIVNPSVDCITDINKSTILPTILDTK